jgi:hypothetical protein
MKQQSTALAVIDLTPDIKEVNASFDSSQTQSKMAKDRLQTTCCQLAALRKKADANHVKWNTLFGDGPDKIKFSERYARTLLGVGKDGKTVGDLRFDVTERVKKHRTKKKAALQPPCNAASDDAAQTAAETELGIKDKPQGLPACDYDWSQPKASDFGDPTEMYRAQAEHYRDESIHFAAAYPLLAPGVNVKVITKSEIQAAQCVVDAWLDVVRKLTTLGGSSK